MEGLQLLVERYFFDKHLLTLQLSNAEQETYLYNLLRTVTLFFNEIGAVLVTGWTGSTLNVAEYDFSAYICFSAVISVNAEVVSIKEGSFMIPITCTMELHFL